MTAQLVIDALIIRGKLIELRPVPCLVLYGVSIRDKSVKNMNNVGVGRGWGAFLWICARP